MSCQATSMESHSLKETPTQPANIHINMVPAVTLRHPEATMEPHFRQAVMIQVHQAHISIHSKQTRQIPDIPAHPARITTCRLILLYICGKGQHRPESFKRKENIYERVNFGRKDGVKGYAGTKR